MGLPAGATIISDVGLGFTEYGLECIVSGEDFSLTVAAVGALFDLLPGTVDLIKDTKIAKNLISKIQINMPRILTDESYFNEIKTELEQVIEREKRRDNTTSASKKIANATSKFDNELVDEMFVYGAQNTVSEVFDVNGALKDATVSYIENEYIYNRK